jgi:universal stress protein A
MPMTAQHILVPTDFSEYADYALDYAMALATALPARLTLLHVIQLTPMTTGEMLGYSLEVYLEAMESEAQKHMQALLNRVQQAGLQGETAIVQGVPFQLIVEMVESQDIDLIVMGTHSRTGLTHALMGSVAEKVVRLAPCPVLVTRETTDASEA